MKIKHAKTVSCLFFLFILACGKTVQDESPSVVSVNGTSLSLQELRSVVPQDFGIEISQIQIQNYIQTWMETELLYQKALTEGLQNDPEVKDHLHNLEKTYLASTYLDTIFEKEIDVTDEEVESFYKKESSSYIRPETLYDIDVILVDDLSAARDAKKQIDDGNTFADVAKSVSLDVSKDDGGKLGWVPLDALPQDISRDITRASIKSITSPVKSNSGYYILRVNGVRDAGQVETLEEVKEQIIANLKAVKREKLYNDTVKKLHENAEVRLNWSMMDSIDVK